jgi:hypothetical protein
MPSETETRFWSDASDRGRVAILVTASCTTGWRDWIHGALWLLPDALLRRRLGLPATIAHGNQPTISCDDIPKSRLTDAEILDIEREHETNVLVRRDEITSASLRRGIVSSRLRLELLDGRKIKLYWLKADPAYDLLRPILRDWLADRLEDR